MRINGKTVNDAIEFYRGIVDKVYEYARQYSHDENIRDFIAHAVGKDISYKDTFAIASRILKAVQDEIGGPNNYLPDAIRNETIQPPIKLIERWKKGLRSAGDCDDFTALLHTLYHSVGIPSVAIFVHFRKYGGDPTIPNHIALAVKIGDKWYVADPTSRLPILTKDEYERKVGPIIAVYPLKIDGTLYSPLKDGWATSKPYSVVRS